MNQIVNQEKIKFIDFKLGTLFERHPDFEQLKNNQSDKEVKHQYSTIFYDAKKIDSEAENNVCCFCYDGEELIGGIYYYLSKDKAKHGSIYAVFSHRKGVGGMLLERFHKTLYDQGYKFIRFYANHAAIGFYLRYGYKFFGLSKSEQLPLVYAPILDESVKISNEKFYNSENLFDVLSSDEIAHLEKVYHKSFINKGAVYKKKLKHVQHLYENNIFIIDFEQFKITVC